MAVRGAGVGAVAGVRVAEAALAHTLLDRVKAAYRRGDLFEKRRGMMEWSP